MLSRAIYRSKPREGHDKDVQDDSTTELSDSKSVHEQAEAYRICTARFPIDALTASWADGSNRPVDEQHVLSLCRAFEGDGLQRNSDNNHLMVGCTRFQFQRMQVSHLVERDTSTWASNSKGPWPSFDRWMTVNKQKVEIISGQHRVEALKLFLKRKGCNPDTDHGEYWWICDVYDLDKLPQKLKIKLRANRHNH
ncbi:hypothetical protein BJ878DRAFT_38332, partial [Calycina marina]